MKQDCTLSFDIIDWKDWSSKNLKIVNVKHRVAGSPSIYAELTNIPVTEAGIEYLEADATINDGVKFVTFDYKSSGPACEFTFSSDSRVQIIINFRQEYWHW